MSIDLPLDSMTMPQKLQAMEALWASICSTPSQVDSPAWHEEVLADRKRRLETGEATLSDWADAKKRIQDFGT